MPIKTPSTGTDANGKAGISAPNIRTPKVPPMPKPFTK